MARSKQFSVEFISDRPGIKTAHGMDALGGSFSTIAGARRSIAKIRKEYAPYNPREFAVFDSWADPIPNPVMNGEVFVPCVYCEL